MTDEDKCKAFNAGLDSFCLGDPSDQWDVRMSDEERRFWMDGWHAGKDRHDHGYGLGDLA